MNSSETESLAAFDFRHCMTEFTVSLINVELTCTEPLTFDKSFDLAESNRAFLMTELIHATTACLAETLAHCDASATIWPLEQVG